MWFVYLIPNFFLCFTESSKEQFAYTNIAEELVKLFKKQIEHDKKEMIFEVLAPLAENGENLIFFFLTLFFLFISLYVFWYISAFLGNYIQSNMLPHSQPAMADPCDDISYKVLAL